LQCKSSGDQLTYFKKSAALSILKFIFAVYKIILAVDSLTCFKDAASLSCLE
jgi:hypothetical protein